MNLGNKGFAISGILYTLFIIFLLVSISILGGLSSKKKLLEQSITSEQDSFVGKKVEETKIDEIKTKKTAIVKGKYIYILKIDETNVQKCSAYLKKGTVLDTNVINFIPSICNDYNSSELNLSEVYSFEEE